MRPSKDGGGVSTRKYAFAPSLDSIEAANAPPLKNSKLRSPSPSFNSNNNDNNNNQKNNTIVQYLANAMILLLYMIIGPTLVIVNKWILYEIEFKYPLFLSGLGLVFVTIVTQIGYHEGLIEMKAERITLNFWFQKILPVGACHAATLAFGNAQYIYMGIGIIQMLKAMTPLVVAIVSFFALGEKPSLKVLIALMGVCFGTAMTAAGDTSLSTFGFLLAFGSSVTESIRLVMTQFLLKDLKFGIWEGQYYLAPAGALSLFLGSLLLEGKQLKETGDLHLFSKHPTLFLGAATLGLGVQILTSLVIKITNSVTLKVLAQVRNAGLIIWGVVFFGEIIVQKQYFGYMITIFFFLAYSKFKMEEKK